MSTRRTVSVRLRAQQLFEIRVSLSISIDAMVSTRRFDVRGTQRRRLAVVRSALERVRRAEQELQERV